MHNPSDANSRVRGRGKALVVSSPMGRDQPEPVHFTASKRGLQVGTPVHPSSKLCTNPPTQRSAERPSREHPGPGGTGGYCPDFGFYSHIFVVLNPSSKFCLIINLQKGNKYLQYKKFDMASIYSVKYLPSGVFMVTLDLKDVYLHVPISPEHQRFLRFVVLTGQGVQHGK